MVMIAVVFIVIEFFKFVIVLTVQRYVHIGSPATNDYELFSILHYKKNETQLSTISIATYKNKQKD